MSPSRSLWTVRAFSNRRNLRSLVWGISERPQHFAEITVGTGECAKASMGEFPRGRNVALLICTSTTIASLLSQSLVWWQFRVWAMWPLRLPRLSSLVPLALVGPIAYLLLAWILHH